jgi:hypothetical protein
MEGNTINKKRNITDLITQKERKKIDHLFKLRFIHYFNIYIYKKSKVILNDQNV